MKLSSTMRYFNEYFFYRTFAYVNQMSTVNGRPISTTEGRALHKKFLQEFAAMQRATGKAVNMSTAGYPSFSKAANAVFSEYLGGDLFTETSGKKFYDNCIQWFSKVTGINSKDKAGQVTDAHHNDVLPLSPFDERFSGRSTFLQNGGVLLYAMGQDMEFVGETFGEGFPLYTVSEDGKSYQEAGYALTEDDKSGMSMLMPYLSEREYNAVASWVNKVGETDPSKYMSHDALERSCAILRALQEEGTEYTVSCDGNVGQIKANLTGTRISIRLTDARENEKFIGRVYDDGHSIYYMTNKRDPATGRNCAYENPTAQDCINLLHFAQGKSVMRKDVNQPVGKVGTYERGMFGRTGNVRRPLQFQEAYHPGKNYSAVAGVYPGDPRSRVLIHVDSSRSLDHTVFRDEVSAETFLRTCVQSARGNFLSAMDIDRLVQEAKDHAGEEDYMPDFSGDSGIAAIQLSYWQVLSGAKETLLKPGMDVDDYEEYQESLSEFGLSGFSDFFLNDMTYSGTPEEIVRSHLLDNVDYLIGQYDPDGDGKRFDPVNVSTYMSSEFGKYRNNSNIVAALRSAGVPPEELKGSDFYNGVIKDKMVAFDKASARPMAAIANPFLQDMFREIKQTISETGCLVQDKDILIDSNGIVHYTAERVTVEKTRPDGTFGQTFEGEIGQIFLPDDLGLVETKFAGSQNYLFSPGYEAYVVPQVPGENLSLEERTRLRGYEQIMRDTIRYQIRSDLISAESMVGTTTSLNNAYRRLYDTRYPLDFLEQSRQEGMSDDLLRDILKTNSRRVRYGNEFRDNSTINADFTANLKPEGETEPSKVLPVNDNFRDYYNLTGRRNMSILTQEGDGYFDPAATGTSVNQGITRYLVESAKVLPDGRMVRGDLDDKTPLMKNEACRYFDYIPFDRRQMTFNNLLKASCLTKDTYTAQMTFGGWNFDDGYVVSKAFAEKYQIRGTGHVMRNLTKGDKISDMYGNKGVISLVADPEMHSSAIEAALQLKEDSLNIINGAESEAVAIYKGQEYTVAIDTAKDHLPYGRQAALQVQKALGYEHTDEALSWFEANPKLEVVGAPFPACSRFNAGSARELMQSPEDLHVPDGRVLEGCMGKTTYIVTHMSVDEKTHIYGEDKLAQGRGRKASAQLAWALCSQDAKSVMDELYGSNTSGISNLRELLITVGLDISETGDFRKGYTPHPGEERNLFPMPDLEYRMVKNRTTGDEEPRLDINSMRGKFADVISNNGGVLEVPFALTYAAGNQLEPMTGTDREGTFALPIMSSYLRSGQAFEDGTSTVHDYTNHYLKIYELSCQYRDAQNKQDGAGMAKYQNQAQAEYNKIMNDITNRHFTGKHNIFRDTIMSNRMPDSATAVWTADPRLAIDQVAIPTHMAESQNLKDNDYVMIWRDPVLREEGVSYMRVKVDPTLTGIAINPVQDKKFDGDFDGDSAGEKKLHMAAARREAMLKLSIDANLLEQGVKDPVTGIRPLQIQDSLDLKTAAFRDPSLKERRSALEKQANAIEDAFAAGKLSEQDVMRQRHKLVGQISDYVLDSLEHEYATDVISFKDMPSHIKSVEHMVLDGAKGNYAKLADYAKYLGVTYERAGDAKSGYGEIIPESVKDMGHSLAGRQDDLNTQYATAIKAFGTGVAGMYSQRGICALRNHCIRAVLEWTYPNTQSILQAKHDPVEARHKYEMLMRTGRELWRGNKMTANTDPKTGETYWMAARQDGHTVQATPEEFVKQMIEIYESKDGFNVPVNRDLVKDIAKVLKGSDGKMRNIEQDGKELASVMDQLAYGGTFVDLMRMANNGQNLFEGTYNKHFAPKSVQKNWELLAEGEVTQSISKSDTKERTKLKASQAAVAVGNRQGQARKDPDILVQNLDMPETEEYKDTQCA